MGAEDEGLAKLESGRFVVEGEWVVGLSRLGPGWSWSWASPLVAVAVAVTGAAAVDVAIGKVSGLCGGSLVSILAGDDLALRQVIGNGLGDGSGVDGPAADVPVDEGEEQNSHGVDAGVVHLLCCEYNGNRAGT